MNSSDYNQISDAVSRDDFDCILELIAKSKHREWTVNLILHHGCISGRYEMVLHIFKHHRNLIKHTPRSLLEDALGGSRHDSYFTHHPYETPQLVTVNHKNYIKICDLLFKVLLVNSELVAMLGGEYHPIMIEWLLKHIKRRPYPELEILKHAIDLYPNWDDEKSRKSMIAACAVFDYIADPIDCNSRKLKAMKLVYERLSAHIINDADQTHSQLESGCKKCKDRQVAIEDARWWHRNHDNEGENPREWYM